MDKTELNKWKKEMLNVLAKILTDNKITEYKKLNRDQKIEANKRIDHVLVILKGDL